MAHVFIVDEKTFDIHLKYNFAGTGSKDNSVDFIDNCLLTVPFQIEKMLIGMIADISRIRVGDKIIFYLQQKQGREGRFFGAFEVVNVPFLCNDNYLENELEKKLTFRVELKPYEVYPIGVTERECLDSLYGINKPYELCWSLIYRKLSANRGCTMITDAEYEFMMNKIRKKNSHKLFTNKLKFNAQTSQIEVDENEYRYLGNKESLNIFNRLKYKYDNKNSYETHLQSYIVQNLENINELKVTSDPITWIGNEMSCGVGMQSIDVIFIQQNKKEVHIILCELKDEQPEQYIKGQLFKYIDWLYQYIVPTYKHKRVFIHPTIVAPEPKELTKEKLKQIDINFAMKKWKFSIFDTRYVSFKIEDESLKFQEERL